VRRSGGNCGSKEKRSVQERGKVGQNLRKKRTIMKETNIHVRRTAFSRN
jgi:hypothetical protein